MNKPIPKKGIRQQNQCLLNTFLIYWEAKNSNVAICVRFDNTLHEIEVKWKEMYFHVTTIHIWGDIPFLFNFKQTLQECRKGTQHALYKRLLTEVDGDRMLTTIHVSCNSIF